MREEQRSRVKIFKGVYFNKAREEELKSIEYAREEEERGAKLVEKMRHYDEYVQEHFKPKIMSKKQNP